MRAAMRPFGIELSPETCRRGHYALMTELDRVATPPWQDWNPVNQYLARWFGTEDPAAAVALEAIYSRGPFAASPDTAIDIRALGAAGIRMGVVSNATGALEETLRATGLYEIDGISSFEVVIDSAVVAVEKPDPTIFNFALSELQITSATVVYVGDSVFFDVKSAEAAGLIAVHFDPYQLCGNSDHLHCRRLADLLPWLPSISRG